MGEVAAKPPEGLSPLMVRRGWAAPERLATPGRLLPIHGEVAAPHLWGAGAKRRRGCAGGAGGLDRLEEFRQLSNARGAPPSLLRKLLIGHVLVMPRDLVRDVDRAPAKRNHGDHVRAQRVADHDELVRLDAAPLKDAAIGVDVLRGEDLDAEKQLAEA